MTKKTAKVKEDPIVALIRRTDQENPKPEDLKLIREHLDQNDALVRWNESSQQAYDRVIASYTKSALSKELFQRQIKAKRKELDHESADAMVKMLIDQVILSHIRLTIMEGWHAEKVKESHSTETGLYWDKMLTSYQRRFQKACESLAKVTKLLSEAELRDQQARNKRSQSTLVSASLYKKLSG